jgi:hypothetical protein
MNINLRILLLKTFASEGSSRSRTAMAFVRHREKPSPREMVNREAQTSEKLQVCLLCFFEGPNEVDLMRRSSSRDNANQRWTQRLLHFGPRTNTQPTFHFSVFDSRNILKLVFFFFFYPKEICTEEKKNQNEYLGTKSRKSDPKKKAFLCILWAKRTRRRRRTRKMFCKQMHTCLPLSLRS